MKPPAGTVHLVGAGPGDPELITVRGLMLIKRADVIIYDRLVCDALLIQARPETELVNVGKEPGRHCRSQDDINAIIVDRARRGLTVVRLKGGDPFVFGRGFEELAACVAAGIDCDIVPGVSSAISAPAAVGIPVTSRGISRAFVVVTARTRAGESEQPLDYRALAAIDTIVIMMGRAKLREITLGLINAGRNPAEPAACIERATTPQQRLVRAPLDAIADAVEREGLTAPVVTIIGDTVALAEAGVTLSRLSSQDVA